MSKFKLFLRDYRIPLIFASLHIAVVAYDRLNHGKLSSPRGNELLKDIIFSFWMSPADFLTLALTPIISIDILLYFGLLITYLFMLIPLHCLLFALGRLAFGIK